MWCRLYGTLENTNICRVFKVEMDLGQITLHLHCLQQRLACRGTGSVALLSSQCTHTH